MRTAITSVIAVWLVYAVAGCGSSDKAEVARLTRYAKDLESQVSRLRVEKESLGAVLSSQGTSIPSNPPTLTDASTPGASAMAAQPPPGDAPEYLYGEIVTRNCIRISVERFGTTEEKQTWWFATAEVSGMYKDQSVKVPMRDIKRIWPVEAGDKWNEHVGIELRDGRFFDLSAVDAPKLEYVNTDEITRQRTNRWTSWWDVLVLTFSGVTQSISWCPKCQRYFPDIYKYCNKCGAELHERKTPQ